MCSKRERKETKGWYEKAEEESCFIRLSDQGGLTEAVTFKRRNKNEEIVQNGW